MGWTINLLDSVTQSPPESSEFVVGLGVALLCGAPEAPEAPGAAPTGGPAPLPLVGLAPLYIGPGAYIPPP